MRRAMVWLLVLSVLLGSGQGVWASSVQQLPLPTSWERYGQPVSDERLEELDGEWVHIALGGLYGGLGSAVNYTVVHYGDDWSWAGLGRSTAIGVVGGA